MVGRVSQDASPRKRTIKDSIPGDNINTSDNGNNFRKSNNGNNIQNSNNQPSLADAYYDTHAPCLHPQRAVRPNDWKDQVRSVPRTESQKGLDYTSFLSGIKE